MTNNAYTKHLIVTGVTSETRPQGSLTLIRYSRPQAKVTVIRPEAGYTHARRFRRNYSSRVGRRDAALRRDDSTNTA
jgi:hypothetical protein